MTVIWAILLFVVCLAGWILNLLGMPGNWLNVGAVLLYTLLMPEGLRVSIGWPVVIAITVLAVLGEVVEFVAGAMGVSKLGGTRRAALLAIVGSLLGSFAGLFIGLPVPVLGSVIAVLACASIGALAGAMLGEHWAGRSLQDAWNVGHAAFWGRLFGSLGKTLLGSVIVALVLMALLWK